MIETLLEFLRTLTNPEKLIHALTTVLTGWWGYGMLCGVIFAETGLLTGFFLPGDSLLFTVGVVAGAGHLDILLVNLALMAAAIAGDSSGYFLGRRTGPRIFNRPNSRFFHQEHLRATQEFYQKHGGKTIVYAKFLPILRTFAPFVAGVAQMKYRKFFPFSACGCVGWIFSLTLLGYVLGSVPLVRAHFEKVIMLIIFLSLLPVLSEAIKARRAARSRSGPRA
jgi:membrane-associated protein